MGLNLVYRDANNDLVMVLPHRDGHASFALPELDSTFDSARLGHLAAVLIQNTALVPAEARLPATKITLTPQGRLYRVAALAPCVLEVFDGACCRGDDDLPQRTAMDI